MAFLFTSLTLIAVLLMRTTLAFSGNFELTNLVVSSPFQADPYSIESTYVEFDFCDQDTPEVGSTHCGVQWAVGLSPPKTSPNTCDNTSFSVTVTSWFGVANLTLQLGHQYIDDSVGKAPYNVLSKYANFNLTYPHTPFYECDMAIAECKGCDGETIFANVTSAVA
ncbi:hypothetical protein A1O7_03821 [Cladophialophora yegresii CBS 114405]|uniref:AA1-like domain-containing protein n=1 Tax=Cladophialophora yegresii CBS 114405 TaxID=1182544 RepID=W9W3U4_9EURO|nr:uncharacterized protein A1O7_03821 [Cladophialophora yegresii CBS 114405]EXJ59675.1 hypothetical protein A1O7_03821 [Cladophialophora yegresii CBS 114405]